MDGNGLTPAEALNLFGCFRLAARIDELRKQGHTITTTTVRRGEKEFAEYRYVRTQHHGIPKEESTH